MQLSLQYRVESMLLRLAKPSNFIAISPSVQQRARYGHCSWYGKAMWWSGDEWGRSRCMWYEQECWVEISVWCGVGRSM